MGNLEDRVSHDEAHIAVFSDNFSNKAEYFMLLGKVLNVTSDYDPKAEEHLSKAVKLDPKLVEAWNQLGEAYWKKGNINGAKNCFKGALTHVGTCRLSTIKRQKLSFEFRTR